MDTRDAARRWLDRWLRGWPARDVDGIAAMYTGNAVYSSHPFRALEPPMGWGR